MLVDSWQPRPSFLPLFIGVCERGILGGTYPGSCIEPLSESCEDALRDHLPWRSGVHMLWCCIKTRGRQEAGVLGIVSFGRSAFYGVRGEVEEEKAEKTSQIHAKFV